MSESFKYSIHFPADNYILIDFGNRIDENLNKFIMAFEKELIHDAILEVIPAYSSILIEYDHKKVTRHEMNRLIKDIKPDLLNAAGSLHEIPVVYGGEHGPDLSAVAEKSGLSEDDVIRLHTSAVYRVFMLGFLPGFCYLGGLDPRLEIKRLDSPRLMIPAGSVGIAGRQTGIYPSDSPGGWRIIGRTRYKLYNPGTENIFPVKPGDSIRFKAVQNGF